MHSNMALVLIDFQYSCYPCWKICSNVTSHQKNPRNIPQSSPWRLSELPRSLWIASRPHILHWYEVTRLQKNRQIRIVLLIGPFSLQLPLTPIFSETWRRIYLTDDSELMIMLSKCHVVVSKTDHMSILWFQCCIDVIKEQLLGQGATILKINVTCRILPSVSNTCRRLWN